MRKYMLFIQSTGLKGRFLIEVSRHFGISQLRTYQQFGKDILSSSKIISYICISYGMKGMKRYIFMAIFAAALISCSDGLSVAPAISFNSDKPEIGEETAIFRLATAFMSDDTERTIPVTFGGTAERGVDYTASADAFAYGGESPVDSIVITTLKFGTEKTLELTIGLPEGIDGGNFLTSGFTLQDFPAYVTFSRDFGILTDSRSLSFALTDKEGTPKSVSQDVEVSIILDKEKSTAAEGDDFSFADSTHFTIKAGKSSGTLMLTRPEGTPITGKDRIFLRIGHDERYGTGKFSEMEVCLMENSWNDLDGKWDIDSLVTDSLYMSRYWGEGYSGMELYPKKGLFDYLEFDIAESAFKPGIFSRMKNYFLGDTYFKTGPVIEMDFGEGKRGNLQTFLINNTNRYFSEDIMSEDTESYIGLQILKGTPDTLSLYLIDYISKSFLPELEAEGKYAPEKPVAASPGLFINARYTKAE